MNPKIETLLKQANSPAAETSSVTSSSRVFSTEDEAAKVFQVLREKLFRIENWNSVSDISSFAQYDENGNAQSQKAAAVGNMIKISMPASGKDDWVKIIKIYDTPDEVVLTLQPSFDPTAAEDKTTTSHFFVDTSTNNFCLQRHDKKINFYIIGLDERTNTQDTDGLLETIRNLAVSNIGCYFGIQKAQWQSFADNFLTIES